MTKRDAKKVVKLYEDGATLGEVADAHDLSWAEAKQAIIDAGGTIRRGRPRKRA